MTLAPTRLLPHALGTLAFLLAAVGATAQERLLPLDSAAGLILHNTQAAAVSFEGKSALKLTATPAAAPAAKKSPSQKGGAGAGEANRADHLAIVEGVDFTNGTIEVDLAGEPGPGAAGGARGFVGVAFRVQPDRRTYDCFYLRPTNGRADDQERRNHSAQ